MEASSVSSAIFQAFQSDIAACAVWQNLGRNQSDQIEPNQEVIQSFGDEVGTYCFHLSQLQQVFFGSTP